MPSYDDTFYVSNMKGVGRIYQQTFVDTTSKVAFARLYDRRTPITAADLLNVRVVPFFDEREVKLSRAPTDRGTQYYGNPEHHAYALSLAIENTQGPRCQIRTATLRAVATAATCCPRLAMTRRKKARKGPGARACPRPCLVIRPW